MFFFSTNFFPSFLQAFIFFKKNLSKQSWMFYFLQTHFHSLHCKFSLSMFFNFFVLSFSTFTNVLFSNKLHMYHKFSFFDIFFYFFQVFFFPIHLFLISLSYKLFLSYNFFSLLAIMNAIPPSLGNHNPFLFPSIFLSYKLTHTLSFEFLFFL
jgi:hypothetical protein